MYVATDVVLQHMKKWPAGHYELKKWPGHCETRHMKKWSGHCETPGPSTH